METTPQTPNTKEQGAPSPTGVSVPRGRGNRRGYGWGGAPISLPELLASRDARQAEQRRLQALHPQLTLLCLTVIMPGKVKRNHASLTIARAARDAIHSTFGTDLTFEEWRDLPTGYEGYLLTPLPPLQAKTMACDIEDRHPLGRLFDIDVLSANGIPMQREQIGRPQRRCLLCNNEARYCMRNRTHTTEQLLEKINEMVAPPQP